MASSTAVAILILGTVLAQCATAKFQFRKAKGKGPLRLAGANCADPGTELPKYCCNGIVPAEEFMSSCECNPGWSHKECICKAHLTQNPCHSCMVHLPETNRWLKTFHEEDLYGKCETCVEKCKGKLDEGECSDFMGDVWEQYFPGGDPVKVLCNWRYLKKQLMRETYPLDLKRQLYSTKYDPSGTYNQPTDWKVAGVGPRLPPKSHTADVKKEIEKISR
eukprot:gnl/TRDRNA2_/TRDRNA2_130707_c0_seq3.p1 gnl/TRDRNA2_/TRDRNA2_130707_c0~~gnl/TRDRNA2_/TRDRNA2_130707_c0_seq3.p1  ORF type:complete len:220 (+),score=47.77 gnl/TRDRNA2_/TRDRNA2_130707_c0_seq3:56-715(+)